MRSAIAERLSSVLARDGDRLLAPNCGEKALELEPERLVLRRDERHALDERVDLGRRRGRSCARSTSPAAGSAPPSLWPRSSEKYPLGWKIRSLRTRSRETRLAVMFATAPPANSSRALAMSTERVSSGTPTAAISVDAPTDEGLHQIDVMDHEVEHDRHVRPARRERRQPVALDEARAVDVAASRRGSRD